LKNNRLLGPLHLARATVQIACRNICALGRQGTPALPMTGGTHMLLRGFAGTFPRFLQLKKGAGAVASVS
jgi:hypothetical protein